MVEIKKLRPKAQFLEFYGTSSFHAMRKGATKCYFILLMSAASAEMAILQEGVCAGSCQTVGSPARPFLISCQGGPSSPHPSPCPAHQLLQRAGVLQLQQKTCSALSTMLLLLCRLLVLWGRKAQTCFGPKPSKMMPKFPFFLVWSICLLIHPYLTKTMISNWVGPHSKEVFLVVFFFR